MKDYKKYEDNVLETDFDIESTDIKINPDFYIHKALLKAQDALAKENTKEGILGYIVLIDHLKVLCEAADMIAEDDFKTPINKLKDEEAYKELDKILQLAQVANIKLKVMMQEVFKSKLATEPMKL